MIINKYCVVLILIILCSTAEAQKLKITSPTQGETWIRDKLHNLSWEAYNLNGSVIIEYKENGNWASYNEIKDVPIGEGETPFYVKNNYGDVIKIRIKSIERPSISDEVTVNISDSNSQPITKTQSTTQYTSGNYLLITSYDNIRSSAENTGYNRIANCQVNEYYSLLAKEGNWYKIKLPNGFGYTHYSNGKIITQLDLARNPGYTLGSATLIPTYEQFSGNYWSLVSGGIFGGFNFKPELTYGYMLSGPMFKLGPLLIGTGSLSSDYHSTYRIGLGFSEYTVPEEIESYYMIFENFMDNNDIEHFIIDFGSQFIMMDPNVFVQLGYRYQYNEENKKTIHSHLSGLHFDIGLYLGGLW